MSRNSTIEELERDFKILHARCRASEDEADALRARCERLETLVSRLRDEVSAPEANCSCHISPPCEDCVQFGNIRELLAEAEAALSHPDGPQEKGKEPR